ncbi:hypothetical protein F3K34_13305 [Streptomyces sp. LBUM 1486]|uniref:hypothetical protein n=1 Tax=Streptomyces scabiei TaxID=1930 RepID=UPI001B33BFE4|nr:hypothetical protein [Streptomyces sp. LBUM 1486]MBP5913210.1 hypothetical protein [Streptomyces sp. LBUM 1486]
MSINPNPDFDRIPIARSVSYAVTGAPDLPAHGATIPGTTLAPNQVTFTYRAAPDSQLGRIQARVKGWWMRNGERYPTEKPMGQHYYGGPDGWPEWLAEEARLHDPARASSAVSVVPSATNQAALRELIADAIRAAACPGECGKTEEECTKERIQPFAWHHGRVAVVEGEPEMFADAVLAVLPAPVDRAAVLREAADAVDNPASVRAANEIDAAFMARSVMATKLRRMADEAEPVAVSPDGANETAASVAAPAEPQPEPTAEDIARANVLALHQIGEQLAGIESWMWEHLADVRDAAKAQAAAGQPAAVDTSEDRCAECGHFRGAHEKAEEPVSVGRCTVCADEDERHDFEAVEELRRLAAEAPHTETPDEAPPREPHPTEADLHHALAVLDRFHGRDTTAPADSETVHACPPDGSGLTPCCGRTPFELPRTDRISSEPAAITCAPAVVAQPGKETDTGARQDGAQS